MFGMTTTPKTTQSYTVTWSMVYDADNHLDAVRQAYGSICDLAIDPSRGANFVLVEATNSPAIRTAIQLDEALGLTDETEIA